MKEPIGSGTAGKRICPNCGTSLTLSLRSCPVCALRNGLDAEGNESVVNDLIADEAYRFEHYEIALGEDQKPIELGRGAMGVTYKAVDTNLQCPVALKFINSRYLDDESVRHLFLTEARATAGLRHPNVASVFHLGTVEGEYYYAMEFVEGESLDRVLESRGPLEARLALEIVHQVTAALSAGYRKGLIHRDIKPANLMVAFDEEGEVTVKVIDYGLVRRAQAPGTGKPEAERFIGTPQFASPEQCAGKEADIRSDLYSLGVTLWVMLLGRVPFEGRFSELIRKQQFEPPPFEALRGVPAPVVTLLESLLEKDPRNRPQTPLELRARVREVQKALVSGRQPWSAAFPRPRDESTRSEPWSGGSPYRGLQVFDVENEAVFFGRTRERDEILGTLQTRSTEENRPFVLIFGASGSGKSSLLRAGVMPWLCRPGVIEAVDLWRSVIFRPTDYPGDLLQALTEALLSPGALPEIGTDGTDPRKLAALLQRNPEGVALLLKESLSRVAGDEQRRRNLPQQPVARFALGLDQLEEMFTLYERFSPDSRLIFFRAIRALVESGYGWVVATLRSDFFSRCEELNDLVELKQGNGQYHLLPPTLVQLSQIIRYPAETAGVTFEDHPEKGRLDERIRDDAVKEPGGLPLLEYALDELFRLGGSDGVLSHAEYEALGGVEGALRKRADDVFARLEPGERTALGSVLNQLVRLGSGDDETLTRRVASYETATAEPGAKAVVDALVTARLLTADLDNAGRRTVMVAHEALFRIWPEIDRWAKNNRDFLRVRARLGEALARWTECNRQSDYLLAPGRPLAEAEDLLKNHEHSLDQDEKDYVLASKTRVARGARRRGLIIAGVMAVLAVAAGAAIWEWRSSVQSENRAVSARGSAEGILNYLLNQLSDKLQPIGHLDIIEDVQKQVETYYKNLGFGQEDPNALNNWAILVRAEGDRLLAQGDLGGAKQKFQQAIEIAEKLLKKAPANTTWQRNLSVNYNRLGQVLFLQGDLAGAKARFDAGFEIVRKLTRQDPNNALYERDLGISYNRLGNIAYAQGDLSAALAQYQAWLDVAQKLTEQEAGNSLWQRDLEVVYNKLGDVLQAKGDLNNAETRFRNGLEIAEKLARQAPGNSDSQRDLRFVSGRLGDVLKAKGDLKAATAQYQNGIDVIEKLAKQDPSNGVWQNDLAESYSKIGGVLVERGDFSGAKAQYEMGFEILQKITRQDPTNNYWQRDLSENCAKIGDVLKAQGDFGGAKTEYQRALEIARELTVKEPSSSDNRYLLANCYKGLGILSKQQGDSEGARRNFEGSRDILTNLVQLHGENLTWKADLDLVKKELGEL
ncbi:MAG: protein kinase [Verrucomicrobia bacterium]|nr:protein kinase [Verrucomicrobiota bacterium]